MQSARIHYDLRVPRPLSRLTPGLLAALGFTAAVSPLATDMYLASFRSVQEDLQASASSVQLTLSLFFLGLGAGQLILGTLSDNLGRRRVLLASLSVFTVAGVTMVFTPSIEVLNSLRLVQGFSGAAGIVIARAIAADLSEGETAVRALSIIAMVSGLGPLIAPPIGGITHELFGWRGTLATLALVSILMLLIAWLKIPESLPPEKRGSTQLRSTFAPFGKFVRNPRYMAYLLTFVFGFAAMIAYISASPFVGQTLLGMSSLEYSLGFALSASALVLATLVNSRVAPIVGPRRMLSVGLALLVAGSASMLALTLTGTLGVWVFIACAFVLSGGSGLILSNASALALAEADFARGSGAALLGSLQFTVGGLMAPLVGAWGEHTALPMALAVFLTAAVAAVCAFLGARLGPVAPARN